MVKSPVVGANPKRVEQLLREGRYAQAIDAARQVSAANPGPASVELLRKAYVATGEYYVGRESFRDAHVALNEAEKLPSDDPANWEKLASLRADLGDHGKAISLADRASDPAVKTRILGRIADRGIKEGGGGKAFLPADLHAGFDLVRKAFAEYEKNQDEPARATLGGIGLTSPFLEWKLLLRGLMAWSANDNPRALENWARLTPDRLPARIAAPYRASIEKTYTATLPAERAAIVAQQMEALVSGGGVLEGLRRLRKFMATEETLYQAFEVARGLVPDLKRQYPQLLPKLANAFYWGIVGGGQPDDLARYTRLFGAPIDDPNFHRLQGFITEALGEFELSHGYWGKYEEWIAKHPERWPGPQANRARALVLEKMGQLAREHLESEPEEDFDDFDILDFFGGGGRRSKKSKKPPRPITLEPSAAECFRRASELAPDWVAPAKELLHEYASQPAKAKQAVEDILKRFPNDLPTLEEAAKLYEQMGEAVKAAECLKRALNANPLDRRLRQRVALLALNGARHRAEAGKFDLALAELNESANLSDASFAPAIAALRAAIAVKARADGMQAELDALMAVPDGQPAAHYRLYVEMSRLKVKQPSPTKFNKAFSESLAGPLTAAEIFGLLDALDQYRQEAIAYRGLKSHQKKISDRVAKVSRDVQSEDDLVRIGLALVRFGLWSPLKHLGERGMDDFHNNPYFPFFVGESKIRNKSGFVSYQTGSMYRRVHDLLERDKANKYQRVRELLDERIKNSPDLERWLREPAWFW